MRHAHLALRVGLAFAFLYPPVAAISDPVTWAAYFPSFVHELPIDITIILHAFGALEVVLAVWILSGWRVRVPALIASGLLVAIVVLNMNNFEVVFRDLSIAAMAFALALWPDVSESRQLSSLPPADQARLG